MQSYDPSIPLSNYRPTRQLLAEFPTALWQTLEPISRNSQIQLCVVFDVSGSYSRYEEDLAWLRWAIGATCSHLPHARHRIFAADSPRNISVCHSTLVQSDYNFSISKVPAAINARGYSFNVEAVFRDIEGFYTQELNSGGSLKPPTKILVFISDFEFTELERSSFAVETEVIKWRHRDALIIRANYIQNDQLMRTPIDVGLPVNNPALAIERLATTIAAKRRELSMARRPQISGRILQ